MPGELDHSPPGRGSCTGSPGRLASAASRSGRRPPGPGAPSTAAAICPSERPSTFGAPAWTSRARARARRGRHRLPVDVEPRSGPGLRLATTGVRAAIWSKSSIESGMSSLAGDGEQVKNAVRRAAGRSDRGDRVLQGLARDHLRRSHVPAEEVHDEAPGLLCCLRLGRRERGDPVQPGRADAQELEGGGHRVGGELTPAGTRAGTGDVLELAGSSSPVIFPTACAPTASKTSWMVTSFPRKRPGAMEPL